MLLGPSYGSSLGAEHGTPLGLKLGVTLGSRLGTRLGLELEIELKIVLKMIHGLVNGSILGLILGSADGFNSGYIEVLALGSELVTFICLSLGLNLGVRVRTETRAWLARELKEELAMLIKRSEAVIFGMITAGDCVDSCNHGCNIVSVEGLEVAALSITAAVFLDNSRISETEAVFDKKIVAVLVSKVCDLGFRTGTRTLL